MAVMDARCATDGHTHLTCLPDDIGTHIMAHVNSVADIARTAPTCVAMRRWGFGALAKVRCVDLPMLGLGTRPGSAGIDAALRCLATAGPKYGEQNNSALTEVRLSLPDASQLSERTISLLPSTVVILDLSGSIALSSSQVRRAVTACPDLREVILRRCPLVDDAAVRAIVRSCTQLRALSLSSCERVSDRALLALSERAETLECVGLHGCQQVSDVGLSALSGCARLSTLDVGGIGSLTDWSLGTARWPLLRNLCISGNRALTDQVLYRLAACCPRLARLACGNCPQFSAAGIAAVCSGCPSLLLLHLQGCPAVHDSCLLHISVRCPHLSSLDVRGCTRLTAGGVEAFYCARRQHYPQADPASIEFLANDRLAGYAAMAAALRPRRRGPSRGSPRTS